MPVELEGGCRVTGLMEGEPERAGNALIWKHFDGVLSLRVVRVEGEAELADETLYVFEGSGFVDGTPVSADTGIDVGKSVHVTGSMTLVAASGVRSGATRPASLVRLADQPIQTTGDRWYRELIQGETTQFVGSIPPGRAPDHFHLYEEILCILQGDGIMHAGNSSTPIARGSCVYLPRTQRHCVENAGKGELRLLGVFYPAGSPAVRYPA